MYDNIFFSNWQSHGRPENMYGQLNNKDKTSHAGYLKDMCQLVAMVLEHVLSVIQYRFLHR